MRHAYIRWHCIQAVQDKRQAMTFDCFNFKKYMWCYNAHDLVTLPHTTPQNKTKTRRPTAFPALHSVTSTSAPKLFLMRACIAHPVDPWAGLGSITVATEFWEKALKIVACGCGDGGTHKSDGRLVRNEANEAIHIWHHGVALTIHRSGQENLSRRLTYMVPRTGTSASFVDLIER
jgi:hypothetical protein